MPVLWDYLTAVFEERWWADRQLDDFYQPERFPDWPDRYKVQLQYRGFRRAQRSTVVSNATEDQGPELKRVGAHPRPVLAFWGKEDTAVPIEFSATLLEAMPRRASGDGRVGRPSAAFFAWGIMTLLQNAKYFVTIRALISDASDCAS